MLPSSANDCGSVIWSAGILGPGGDQQDGVLVQCSDLYLSDPIYTSLGPLFCFGLIVSLPEERKLMGTRNDANVRVTQLFYLFIL
jgi:hypothetical protein